MDHDIPLEGRTRPWTVEEFTIRLHGLPEKLELIGGRLYASEEELLIFLGFLLEEVGAARAVRLGDPDVWRRAVAEL
jgi:hypothetical protein